jgi:3-polyprenyl-4-hydroxybenzoate decarboxylase
MIHLVFTATTPRTASVEEFEFVGYLLGRFVSYAVLPDFSVTADLALNWCFSLPPI